MKISVLLPTRDRLELLRSAVASVRRLDDLDWELIISDNCSSGDVEGYVATLDDEHIRYLRTPRVLSVTENWNHALAHSDGDYVIMLGDDDALLSNYFIRTRGLITDFDRPDFIYHNTLLYVYPGALPDTPDGTLRGGGYATFMRRAKQPFLLAPAEAKRLTRKAANFQYTYGLNMQFTTISRRIIDELSGEEDFFCPPFPDYYAMNHLFARATSIVVEPHPLVVIGVSAKSYGSFHSKHREADGLAFLDDGPSILGSSVGRTPLIPGTHINDGWLRAMETLHERLGSPSDLRPNHRRYRMLQIVHVYTNHYLIATGSSADLSALHPHMTRRERVLYGSLFMALALAIKMLPARIGRHVSGIPTLLSRHVPWWNPIETTAHCHTIDEVIQHFTGEDPSPWTAQKGSRLINELLRRFLP